MQLALASPDISNVYTGEPWWGGWGSNPRPADYESAHPCPLSSPLIPSDPFVPGQTGFSVTSHPQPSLLVSGHLFYRRSSQDSQ